MTTALTQTELLSVIEAFVNEVRSGNGLDPMRIGHETSLVDGSTGIDSLDLAALVVDLQERTGKDPFAAGFRNFENAGALVALYS
jgi:acyl carrier protein